MTKLNINVAWILASARMTTTCSTHLLSQQAAVLQAQSMLFETSPTPSTAMMSRRIQL